MTGKSRTIATAMAAVLILGSVADAADSYDDGELSLIFGGGTFYVTSGLNCSSPELSVGGHVADPEITFEFSDDSWLEYSVECPRSRSPWIEEGEIKWWIEGRRLCFDQSDKVIAAFFPTHDSCWIVRPGRFGPEAIANTGVMVWRFSLEEHPKYSSTPELMAGIRRSPEPTLTRSSRTTW